MRLLLPAAAVGAFERALAPFGAVYAIAEDTEDRSGPRRVDLHSLAPPDAALLVARLDAAADAAGIDVPEPRVVALPARDWVAESRARAVPIEAGRFFVHETDYPGRVPPGRIGLRIDAGRAFGTGAHATTKGCLLAIDRLAKARRFAHPLDLGCGTGVLALAMARVWAAAVTASDIDPVAVGIARRNAAHNGIARAPTGPGLRAAVGDGFRLSAVRAGAPYDLIVANILARPLRGMATDLAGALAPGGVAVLSGFYPRDEPALIAAYRARGLALNWRLRLDGWSVVVLRKR
ncbi:MAG: 50S ribosomal protein L11 methyltransferase [Alphaproteobacteria bacterium]